MCPCRIDRCACCKAADELQAVYFMSFVYSVFCLHTMLTSNSTLAEKLVCVEHTMCVVCASYLRMAKRVRWCAGFDVKWQWLSEWE
jgi:hypothetical protein